jgi:hypothetical protein
LGSLFGLQRPPFHGRVEAVTLLCFWCFENTLGKVFLIFQIFLVFIENIYKEGFQNTISKNENKKFTSTFSGSGAILM